MDVLSFSTIADFIKKEINHKCGLNLSQTRILLFFDSNNNEALNMGKLADGLNISLSTLSRQLQQKKTQDFVDIIQSKNNSSKIVKLNSKGIQKLSELKEALSQVENRLFSSMSAEELKSFTTELEVLADHSTFEESV